jgi:hypothetical protein
VKNRMTKDLNEKNVNERDWETFGKIKLGD